MGLLKGAVLGYSWVMERMCRALINGITDRRLAARLESSLYCHIDEGMARAEDQARTRVGAANARPCMACGDCVGGGRGGAPPLLGSSFPVWVHQLR